MSALERSEQYRLGARQTGKEYRLLRDKSHRSGELVSRVQRKAHERAAQLARRVPWQILLEARNQYLEWQEFYYWALDHGE